MKDAELFIRLSDRIQGNSEIEYGQNCILFDQWLETKSTYPLNTASRIQLSLAAVLIRDFQMTSLQQN